MALRVIGAGFGRTGTLSLKAALETLGYQKTHHMMEVMTSGRQVQLWYDIAQGKAPQWDSVFEGFQACVDFPASAYYRELFAEYPDAKVVLSVRDVDRWYESAKDTIYAVRGAIPKWLVALVPRVRKSQELTESTVWQRVFSGRFEDEGHAKNVFRAHIEEVRAHVPPEQLLVFEVKDGWEPLCAFLDCAIPATAFPNVNDKQAFQSRLRILRLIGWLPWLLLGLFLVGVVLQSQ